MAKRNGNAKCRRGWGQRVRFYNHFGKLVASSLQRETYIYSTAQQLTILGTYPNEIKAYIHKKIAQGL